MSSDGSILEFRIISDLEQAKHYRNILSPNETIYDLWDLRYCFFKYFVEYRIHFIVGFRDGKAVGLLPLHLNTAPKKYEDYCSSSQPYYEFFGSGRFQCNRILHHGYELNRDEKQHFYEQVLQDKTHPHCLHNIYHEDCVFDEMHNNVDDYYRDLQTMNHYHDIVKHNFLESERREVKANARQVKKFEKEGRNIVQVENQAIDTMIEYNIERFEKKSFLGLPSTFLRPHRADSIRDMLSLKCFDNAYMVALHDQDHKYHARALIVEYNHVYYYVNGGEDRICSNLMKYFYLLNIQLAKDRGNKVFDIMSGAPGCRKDQRKLAHIPLYILSNTQSHG